MPHIKSVMLAVVIFLSFKDIASQQCGYDNYYLFVVNVHTKNDAEKIPNLRMYLVDEQDKPYTADVLYNENAGKRNGDEHGKWQHKTDTLFFWDNKIVKKSAEGKPLLRQKFYNLGDYYVVAFWLDIVKLKDPLKHPIYKLKIESGANDLTGNLYAAQTFHLPFNKSVRICNNGIADNFKPSKPVETMDGKEFKPIDILLNEECQQVAVDEQKNSLQYAVRFDFIENPNQPLEFREYNIIKAKIYNTQTGKLHQEIYIPSKSISINKESKNIVQFIDFYDRKIDEAKDFSVQMERWRDLKNMVYREKTNYYIFNTSTKQYQLDTTLSNYEDVFYYLTLKTMRRYEYVMTDKSKIKNTYQLENKKWVLIDKDETLFKPDPPKIKYAPKNCILIGNKWHTLPVQAVIGTNAIKIIKDTFWLYNACDDTVHIVKVQSSNRDFFSINQTLLPKQKTPLVFNGILQNSSFDFMTKNFSCYLTLADNHTIGFEVSVPTVSNNATVFYHKDSSVNYAIAQQKNKRYSNAFFTYPNGNLRAQGYIQDGDTSLKVGKWQFYKEGVWGMDEVVYSKEISLTAFDTDNASQHTNFEIKVLENGKWKQPIIDVDNNKKSFYITKETDSILAFTDTTSYGFALPYNKIPANISMQFFLLKPDERTLKIGYYRMPFSVVKDQYTIIPDYSKFANKNRTTYQITDSILQSLEKKYPKIITLYVSRSQRGIDLSKLSYEEKYKVVMQLTNDSCIRFVCNLFTVMNKDRIAFCDNRVYVEINVNDITEFRKQILQLGFAEIHSDIGSNRYWLTHASGKLIDEGFFESFDRLTKNPMVVSAHFNSYHEPELDNK
jgi:hypothetical protein